MKTPMYIYLCIICILCILNLIIYFKLYSRNNIERFSDNIHIEIVVSRYNEDLEWINKPPFNLYPITVYNKGVNNNFHIRSAHTIIKLDNVGRCDHTYLYHIVHNYDKLADITVFLPGSCDIEFKLNKAKQLLYEIKKYKNTVFIGYKYRNVEKSLYDFKLDSWKSTDKKNNQLYTQNKNNIKIKDPNRLQLSKIRPFGKWYKEYFGDLKIEFVSYFGILGISKKHIMNNPKEFYETFLKQLSTSPNPEVGHYIERSWCAIFNPIDDAIFIKQK
jgi:hypothetical protein